MTECPACGKEDPPEVHTCSPQLRCPECGSEDITLCHGYVSNIETNWKTCNDCDWQGAPE